MALYQPPASESDFERNFSQLKPLMNQTEAYYESARCLFCYDAPCVTACPTGIDIPLFIRQIHADHVTGAAKTIYESNPFGYACGKVCPTEVLCEGACVYNLQHVKPIEIGRLQSYATGAVIRQEKQLFVLPPANGKKVAIIGAGPAGLSCACELRMRGFEVVVFEAKDKPSGLTVYGVAPYKITNEEVLDEMVYLEKQFGFQIHYNHRIETREQLAELEQAYEAIFIGIGLGETAPLCIPGEDLENYMGAVEFVERLRMEHHAVAVPARVVVLGGGNTAMDAASECARMGAESVILAYRRSPNDMGAYHFEYDLVKEAGVQSLFNAAPVAILGDNGRVAGVQFQKTILENGKLTLIPNSDFVVEADWVIRATGQARQTSFLGLIPNLETDAKGRIVWNTTTGQTGNPKYFAGGDAANGGKEVVNAAAEGRKAGQHIAQWLLSPS